MFKCVIVLVIWFLSFLSIVWYGLKFWFVSLISLLFVFDIDSLLFSVLILCEYKLSVI